VIREHVVDLPEPLAVARIHGGAGLERQVGAWGAEILHVAEATAPD
jgi:hypothetical protein